MKKGRRKSHTLEELVFVLSPKEKRYIAIYMRQFKSDRNVYSEIYNLVSKYRKLNPKKHTSVLKVQVYWKVLKGLQLFWAENNPVVKKNNLLSQYHILRSKGLDDHALRVLKSAREIFNG